MTLSTFTRAIPLAAITVVLLATGCGDEPSLDPVDHPAALLTSGDFDLGSTFSETSNLFLALQEAGFPLDTTSAEDSTSIATLIAGKEIVFMPETSPSFDEGTEAILRNFVNAGGTIVLVGGYDHVEWVNEAFGLHLETIGEFTDRQMPRALASGPLGFRGPATIQGNDGGEYLVAATLPRGAQVVYQGEDGSRDASVALIPVGRGRLVYFGWDWFNGAPFGTQDGGWRDLLRAMATF